MSPADLEAQIASRQIGVGVVGLGYVGLPAACLFADAGFSVVGVDLDAARIATLKAGRSPIEGDEPGLAALVARVVGAGRLTPTTSHADLAGAGVVLFAIQTPLGDDLRPDYLHLRAALSACAPHFSRGALVIIESTVSPGTTAGVLRKLLDDAGRSDVVLGHCPERVMPGKLLSNMRTLARVCGGSTPAVARTMAALYRTIVGGELSETDTTTAELVKTAENAYRDVNIAFANELAKVCEAAGADFLEVRELVNLSPGRNVLLAGTGVGGHCIPKDPWLLVAVPGVAAQLIPAARTVNEEMPFHLATMTRHALETAGVAAQGARIALLGWSYLEGSDDTRHTPSELLAAALRRGLGAEVVVHDPYVAEHRGDVLAKAKDVDAVVVAVAHPAYRALDLAALRRVVRTPILVDGRRAIDAEKARAAGFAYRAIGLGR